MARHEEPENESSQENWTKERRTVRNHQSHWTSNIPAEVTKNMEDPQRVSRHSALAIQRNRSLRSKLQQTTTWIDRRRRSVWSGEYPATSEKRKGVSILRPMERLPNFGRLVGTGRGILWRRRLTKAVQRTPPALIKTNMQQKNQQHTTWTKIPVNQK